MYAVPCTFPLSTRRASIWFSWASCAAFTGWVTHRVRTMIPRPTALCRYVRSLHSQLCVTVHYFCFRCSTKTQFTVNYFDVDMLTYHSINQSAKCIPLCGIWIWVWSTIVVWLRWNWIDDDVTCENKRMLKSNGIKTNNHTYIVSLVHGVVELVNYGCAYDITATAANWYKQKTDPNGLYLLFYLSIFECVRLVFFFFFLLVTVLVWGPEQKTQTNVQRPRLDYEETNSAIKSTNF